MQGCSTWLATSVNLNSTCATFGHKSTWEKKVSITKREKNVKPNISTSPIFICFWPLPSVRYRFTRLELQKFLLPVGAAHGSLMFTARSLGLNCHRVTYRVMGMLSVVVLRWTSCFFKWTLVLQELLEGKRIGAVHANDWWILKALAIPVSVSKWGNKWNFSSRF